LISKYAIDHDRVKRIQDEDRQKLSGSDFNTLQENFRSTYLKEIHEMPPKEAEELLKKAFDEGYFKAGNLAIVEILRQVNTGRTHGIPIYSESILLESMLEAYKMKSMSQKVEVTLLNAPIINPDRLSWDQIAELKKDADFVLKVKKFGLFINKNYSGKELSYIIDDLSMQLEAYQNACNKHGVELMNGSLKSLADSKSLFGTMGLVVCSLLINVPEAAILTGAIGGVLEVMKMSVTISEIKDRYHSFTKESPISLFHDIEKISSRP
jgi:hypothetical protein